jgi:hypothetical protein
MPRAGGQRVFSNPDWMLLGIVISPIAASHGAKRTTLSRSYSRLSPPRRRARTRGRSCEKRSWRSDSHRRKALPLPPVLDRVDMVVS